MVKVLVFFHPWVGSDYFSGGIFGKRIMVLGESHYCAEACEKCGVDFKCKCNGISGPGQRTGRLDVHLSKVRAFAGESRDNA